MSVLDSIAVHVEAPGGLTFNVVPLLHEVRHALNRLADDHEPTTIDLRAIPFGPGEIDRLLEILGRGEIRATLTALGETHVWETRFPGVWLIDHYNTENEQIALQIEVSEFPSLLRAQPADVRDAARCLQAELAESEFDGPEQED